MNYELMWEDFAKRTLGYEKKEMPDGFPSLVLLVKDDYEGSCNMKILEARYSSEKKIAYDILGKEIGKSKERVRQLVLEAFRMMDRRLWILSIDWKGLWSRLYPTEMPEDFPYKLITKSDVPGFFLLSSLIPFTSNEDLINHAYRRGREFVQDWFDLRYMNDDICSCAQGGEMSVRLYNILRLQGIKKYSEFLKFTREDVLKWRHMGIKAFRELEVILIDKGIKFKGE